MLFQNCGIGCSPSEGLDSRDPRPWGEWCRQTANMWRSSGDINVISWHNNLASLIGRGSYSMPGGWNYPDSLEVGNGHRGNRMPAPEARAHFSLWCVTSSPLYLGTRLENITADDLAIVSNKDAIMVNQAWAGYAGDMLNASLHGPVNISRSNYSVLPSNSVWWKPLPNGTAAVVMYAARDNATIGFRFDELMWQGKPALASVVGCQVRSVWDNTTTTASDGYSAAVPGSDVKFVIIHSCGARGQLGPRTAPLEEKIPGVLVPRLKKGSVMEFAVNVLASPSSGTARRGSGGVFAKGGELLRQLWFDESVAGGVDGNVVVGWDGNDAAGVAVPGGVAHAAVFRWVDTTDVAYEWEGVIGNTGPSTGTDVMISLGPYKGIAIAGDFAVTAVGYTEGHVGTAFSRTDDMSRVMPVGHSDFRRDFSIPATDGELAYFANTAVQMCDNRSAFYSGVTYVAAWNLSTRCEYTFAEGEPDCSVCVGCEPCRHSFDGCNGQGDFFHSVIDRAHDPRTVNDSARRPPPSPDSTGCGNAYLAAATGLAVQRSPGTLLFVAHALLDTVRVYDKVTGASVCNATLPSPRQMSISADGKALWVLINNGTVARYDAALLCQPAEPSAESQYTGPGTVTAQSQPTRPTPTVSLPRSVLSSPSGLFSVSPRDGSIAVCNINTSQVLIFSANGKLVQRLGKEGGYDDSNATVDSSKFFWLAVDPSTGGAEDVFTAFEDDGSLWVSDADNERALHLDPATGRYLGQRAHIPASYAAAVAGGDPTRVFSNFKEFRVGYRGPLNESWSLVRNWAAALAPRFLAKGTRGFAGFRAVQTTPDGRTVSLVQSTTTRVVQKPKPGCHGAHCPESNVTETVEHLEAVELTAAGNVVPLLVLPGIAGSAAIEAGGVIRYSVTNQTAQSIYEMPFSAGNWTFPGRLVTSFAATNLTLAARISGAVPTYPTTATGDLVVFDGSDGHRPTSIKPPFGNHGMHLGVVRPGAGAGFKWQASPWGTWQVGSEPETLDGINGTRYFITPDTKDGRFGGNDTVQYGGSNAHVAGPNIVYGFPGEFFHAAEASQWIHFHDSGLFLGQFGTLNINFVAGGIMAPVHYALNGTSGNAYAPTLVDGPDGQIYLYHNDENAHDGVHRWLLRGAAELELR